VRLVFSPEAILDLEEQAAFIAKDNPDAAEYFLESVESTTKRLKRFPGLGSPRQIGNVTFRLVRLSGFPKHAVAYRSTDDTIEVVRIVHASRDLNSSALR
jgi:toxin ParE1/3/4